MATPDVLQSPDELLLQSSRGEPHRAEENARSRGLSIEKKVEFLESLTGALGGKCSSIERSPQAGETTPADRMLKVSNRRSRRLLNDRLLMELVPRLNAEEIRGLFAPPPWGDDVPPSPFCMANAQEWDKLRNIDMDKEANMIDNMEASLRRRRAHMDADKAAVLSAWRRVDYRTREALRRSFLFELIEGYEACVRTFILERGAEDVLELQVQDPFHRLLLHGVCEFYNLASVTVTQSKVSGSSKVTRITRKKTGSAELPSITLSHFLRMSKEGVW